MEKQASTTRQRKDVKRKKEGKTRISEKINGLRSENEIRK